MTQTLEENYNALAASVGVIPNTRNEKAAQEIVNQILNALGIEVQS